MIQKIKYAVAALTLLLSAPQLTWAQEQEIEMACGHTHKHDVRTRMNAYRPGEVLVNFKPQDKLKVRRKANGKFQSSGIKVLDQVLENLGAAEIEPLMPLTGAKVSRKKMRAFNGQEIMDTDLSNLYRLTLDAKKGISVEDAVKALQEMDEVDFAEPNYLVWANSATDYTTDPMYSQQTNLQQISMPALWSVPSLMSRRPVIAIIDTGVDVAHPDLKDNLWTNPNEAEGAEDTDDDGNGFKDDLHGWDFVNQTGDMHDWNGHGTHCAGIAAATGGNGIGIVGANPDAQIMAVSVLQSDGSGDTGTIIKGIDYAYANGADVLSMSLGNYQHSIAEERALAKAYSRCVIVAAAGNDCISLDAPCNINGTRPTPQFPAAYTFVLGVMAGDAFKIFSNCDCHPVQSSYSDEKLYNYEVSAPGVDILSTYPNGRYKKMSGTSMACPLVAGAVSRLIQCKDLLSQEQLFGDLIYTSKQTGNRFVNIEAAFNQTIDDSRPVLDCLTLAFKDPEGDNDGRLDAGELVEIYPTIRNTWGQAKNIVMSIQTDENEDPNIVEVVDNHVALGAELSGYGKKQSDNPLRIRINQKCVDGRHIRLLMTVTCDNISQTLSVPFTINVENGVELGGTQRENITLYPDVQYIVTRNWGIPKDVVVTVKPGTKIKIKDGVGISNYGHMIFEGKQDSMIVVTKGDLDLGNIGGFLNDNANYVTFKYVIFENLAGAIRFDNHIYENCIIRNNLIGEVLSWRGTFRDCDIYQNKILGDLIAVLSSGATFINSNVHNNEFNALRAGFGSSNRFYHSNFIGNTMIGNISTPGVKELEESNYYGNFSDNLNGYYSIVYNTTEPEIAYLSKCYLGTANEDVAYASILDEVDNVGWGHVDVWQMSPYAYEEAPGCVDYIRVDGVDPQDEAEEMLPLGVGRHKVEIGFNRAMNQNVHPTVSMGVRPPYTQKPINEDGFWFDPYTYVCYITINGRTASDGMNRIRVMDYQQVENDWQLPDEYYRYNVLVQAAGSLSTGMMAQAGLGKVTLDWETDSLDWADLMGYNLYRFTRNDSNECSDTIKINRQLIEPEEKTFTDYDVVPGTTYYYYITEMGTDLEQHDVSRTVAATPLTAQKGDANGSLNVDVADVMTQIAYLSNENPEPFIFEAADVNSDNEVNIMDVVGTLRIITNPDADINAAEEEETALCSISEDGLIIDSPVALGGVQVKLKATAKEKLTIGGYLDGMEQLMVQTADSTRLFLGYSMSGAVVPAGSFRLLEFHSDVKQLSWDDIEEVILSTPRGRNVKVVFQNNETGIADAKEENARSKGIYDMQGRRLNKLPKHGVVIVNGKKVIL